MRIISFIEDSEIINKILKHLYFWEVRSKPPPRANDPPTGAVIIYEAFSSPGADDYLIDAQYPMDLSRRSSKNEDGSLPLKKSSRGQSAELCPNLLKSSIPPQRIDVDIKARFCYPAGYWLRLSDFFQYLNY